MTESTGTRTATLGDGRNTFALPYGSYGVELTATLEIDGEPVDLETADRVTFEMMHRGRVLVDRQATIEDETGRVSYTFRRGDAETGGLHRARFVVREGGSQTVFPSSGSLLVAIERR